MKTTDWDDGRSMSFGRADEASSGEGMVSEGCPNLGPDPEAARAVGLLAAALNCGAAEFHGDAGISFESVEFFLHDFRARVRDAQAAGLNVVTFLKTCVGRRSAK